MNDAVNETFSLSIFLSLETDSFLFTRLTYLGLSSLGYCDFYRTLVIQEEIFVTGVTHRSYIDGNFATLLHFLCVCPAETKRGITA